MHTTRHPNMQLISKVQINGSDINPFMGESFERIGVGPWKKNLLIPNELEIMLTIRVNNGRACFKLEKDIIVNPAEEIG